MAESAGKEPEIDPATGKPKISKRAAEKEAKKAAAKAKKEANKAAAPSTTASKDPVDPFKQGWLKGVYNEKPVKDVHTRFPPEPNGYLHIGHAKAITVNFGFAKSYGGQCNLRFDDTNPAKEEARYFESIEEMVAWLGFKPHKVTYSSDEFDKLYELAEQLIEKDKAYVCHCTKAEMQQGRGGEKGEGTRSVCKHWSRTPEDNLQDFRAMRDGKYEEGQAVLRMKQYLATKPEEYEVKSDDTAEVKQSKAKLKSLAENPALWDAAAYRVKKHNYHHRTGEKWRIYPSYDFSHCIIDALEGITHSLCTVEFETMRRSYDLVLENLEYKLAGTDEKGPMQREYGRLNVEGTILSKRRIQLLVEGGTFANKPAKSEDVADGLQSVSLEDEDEEGVEAIAPASSDNARQIPPAVRDWDDPRLFTLVALRRRGVPPGALKKFVLDLGVTKSNANTMTHSLDSSIRTYLERTVPRLMLVLDPIKVTFTNLAADYLEEREVPFDPKDASKGTHKIPFTSTIYIDRDDFREVDDPDFFRLSPGQSVGLLNVQHPIRVLSFSKDEQTGKVSEIKAEYGADIPAGKARVHWVGESAKHNSPVKAEVRFFTSLFKTTKPNELDWKNGGYHDNLNPDSEVIYKDALIENGFHEIRAGAPWPKEEGEAHGTADKSSTRFQGLRTAFYAEDKDSTEDKIVLNRIVSLKEDTGKKA